MAIWNIDRLEYLKTAEGKTDVVNVVHLRVAASDAEGAPVRHLTQTLEYKAGEPFVPFADLTEAQVIGWVHGKMGEEWVAGMEAEVAREAAVQPTVADELPWASA